MPLKSEHEELVMAIDQQVTQVLLNNGDFTDILISVADRMDGIKKLMDGALDDEIDLYCERYEGFYLLITLLEDLVSIRRVPTHH